MSQSSFSRRDALRLGLATGAGLVATRVPLGPATVDLLAQAADLSSPNNASDALSRSSWTGLGTTRRVTGARAQP